MNKSRRKLKCFLNQSFFLSAWKSGFVTAQCVHPVMSGRGSCSDCDGVMMQHSEEALGVARVTTCNIFIDSQSKTLCSVGFTHIKSLHPRQPFVCNMWRNCRSMLNQDLSRKMTGGTLFQKMKFFSHLPFSNELKRFLFFLPHLISSNKNIYVSFLQRNQKLEIQSYGRQMKQVYWKLIAKLHLFLQHV